MRKVALVFVLAVFVPSLVLAWLAVRSLRDQQFLLERQQSLLYQNVADGAAKAVQEALAEDQRVFAEKVSSLLRDRNPVDVAKTFDRLLRQDWPLARVGFVVNLTGEILSPSPYDGHDARTFLTDNSRFLANRESVEVYWNPKATSNNLLANGGNSSLANFGNNFALNGAPSSSLGTEAETNADFAKRSAAFRGQQQRKVIPQQQAYNSQRLGPTEDNQEQQISKVAASEAEFRQLIGEEHEATLARFVDNKLNLLFSCRPSLSPSPPPGKGSQPAAQIPLVDSPLVFGAQLNLDRLKDELRPLVAQVEPALGDEICLALLDDMAKPVALSRPGFQANWKRPFVATEIGEALPHWEMAVYLVNPAKLAQSARTLKTTLGLLIAVLLLAIAIGSWLIVTDLNRQLTLARQKTDFVSNVSHELKTPLTSIRMFSELLAEGRVVDAAKQRSYLGIITAETARLTRLINNVLDFARLERGEKKYHFQKCDLVAVVRETAETYRPHLEGSGFQFECHLPESEVFVNGDRDALAQVVVNLLSNAEKYADSRKEIAVRIEPQSVPLPHVELSVLDRGLGVPRGCEDKIFEKFYRAHDSLSSGIQGSGLGLTLARQIARAHGGDVVYEARKGGGSCFSLRLPLMSPEQNQPDGPGYNSVEAPNVERHSGTKPSWEK